MFLRGQVPEGRVWTILSEHACVRPVIPHSSFRIPNFTTSSTASGPPVSPVGSVGASACGRGVHRTPAPLKGKALALHIKKARRPYSPRASQIIVLNYAAFFLVQTNAAAAATETAAKAAMPAADEPVSEGAAAAVASTTVSLLPA